MSASEESIPLQRFAEAVRDFTLTPLKLKLLELQNDVAHLDDSNEQLLPFARGTETVLGMAPGVPDPDCIQSIRDNMAVIDRRLDQIGVVRAELDRRGVDFRTKEDDEATLRAMARRREILMAELAHLAGRHAQVALEVLAPHAAADEAAVQPPPPGLTNGVRAHGSDGTNGNIPEDAGTEDENDDPSRFSLQFLQERIARTEESVREARHELAAEDTVSMLAGGHYHEADAVDAADLPAAQPAYATPATDAPPATAASAGNPWTDGTFQTGTIRNGTLHMNGHQEPSPAPDDDDDDGLHL